MDAKRIGRFEIVSTLGRGAQGTVYLAQDTRLKRRVALKTLRVEHVDPAERAHATEVMLGEAHIVGQLSHPNIVALFDAGEEEGSPYLVFEFVEGKTLGDLIRTRGTLAPADAVKVACGMLAAMDYAHEAGVVHRDLKPANVMMTRDDTPRIMDFGIASFHGETEVAEPGKQSVSGTPSYMAPEYLGGAAFTPRCDVFAAGMVLYEMLTGSPAIKGDNAYQTMFAMVKQEYPRPSTRNPAVDEKLEAIVMRALEKDPQARYASASAMLEALKAYANPQPVAAPEGAGDGGVLEFLLRRMRYKSDFPVLSSTITTVNNLVSRENEPTSALADSIIKDVSLTNKLLRMVNTAYFQQFGGSVSTISRAVSILGFQKVRNAALSLMLFDHLQNKVQASDLKDQVTSSYFSGVMSRELVAKLGIKNAEEAFICAMFHRLGKLLAVFYLHDESCEVTRVSKARGITEDVAAVEVIGMSYTDLGLGVAKQWNLPERIVSSMKTASVAGIGNTDESKLRALSELSNRLADAAIAPNASVREGLMKSIDSDFGKPLGLDADKFDALLRTAAETFSTEVRALGLPLGSSGFMKGLRSLTPAVDAGAAAAAATASAETVIGDDSIATGATGGTGAASPGKAGATRPLANPASTGSNASIATGAARDANGAQQAAFSATNGGTQGGWTMGSDAALADNRLDTITPEMGVTPPGMNPMERANMLTAGIQDITNTLAGEYQLNDLLRIILETMYRAIGFTRVMLCTRHPQTNSLRGRLGFGADADQIIKRGFQVPLEVSKDVFYGAISKSADICIEDRDSERVRAYIPAWYRNAVNARGFVLFPVIVNKKPVALIYADHEEAGRLKFADGELNLLKTLRNQAILAIRQKSSG
jgi:serine/threonine protein kinase